VLAGGFVGGQVLGLVTLGFSSVYREEYEVVLFLQNLQLQAGTPTVLEGVAIGERLQRRLRRGSAAQVRDAERRLDERVEPVDGLA
jgi:hypothetical protein